MPEVEIGSPEAMQMQAAQWTPGPTSFEPDPPLPEFRPEAGSFVIRREKRGQGFSLPAVHFAAKIAPAGNVLELTPDRAKAVRVSKAAAEKVLQFYARKAADKIPVGTYSIEAAR
jgi:hypothetical protein